MNSSDAFSDYMVSYSVNKSINLSPTHGRLHRNRESTSMGPTICLINRSRSKIEESTAVQDRREEELISKLFMLSMQVQRLGEENRQLRIEKEEWSSIDKLRETSRFREQQERLQMSQQRNNSMRLEMERNYANQTFELKEKLASLQAENRTLNRRVRQNQKELEEMQLKERINESTAERARAQASKVMEMSMHFNSTNADLHKSFARERNLEADGLREKVNRCQEIIRDQKFIISGQKEEINKEKGKQNEIEVRYERELDFVRRQLQQLQKEGSQISQEEVKKLQSQIRDWQSRVIKSQEELKDKCLIIANQVKTISQYEDRCNDLERRIQDMQFIDQSKIIRAEEAVKLANKEKERQGQKLRKEIQKHLEELDMLKTIIQQYKLNIAEKDDEVNKTSVEMKLKLKQKQALVRKLRRKDKEQQNDMKMSKSLSVDNTMISNKLKTSQVNLGHIVNSVMELKDSHDKSTRLFGRTAAAASRQIYYAK